MAMHFEFGHKHFKAVEKYMLYFLRMTPPLPEDDKKTLKVHEIFSQDDPPLPEDDENKEKRTDDISSWDADFLKVDKGKR